MNQKKTYQIQKNQILFANSKEDKEDIEVSSLSNVLAVVELVILQVNILIKTTMIVMKANMKIKGSKISQ